MDYFKLIISLCACLGAGILGSVFTTASIPTWYAGIHKPSFNPPNWVFGPVWTLLYILMGISWYLVWSTGPTKTALLFFSIQLVLNVLWSILFFGLKNPVLASMEIIVLWLAILGSIISFYTISKTASFLLLPYIIWVSFAALLAISIALLNASVH